MSRSNPATPWQPSIPGWLLSIPIAHRGLHKLPETPENSLAAFLAAASAGYPAELDVRLLADGAVAVFHDSTLDRMTGAAGPIANCLAGDLSDLHLLETGETIPLLETTLEVLNGRTPLLIEVKSDISQPVGPLEDAVIRCLDTYEGEFALQSFRVETVAFLKHTRPGWTTGQLASNDDWAAGRTAASDFGDPLPFDFIVYSVNALPTPVSTLLHEAGVPLIAWTPNSPETLEKAKRTADNYIFDHLRPPPG